MTEATTINDASLPTPPANRLPAKPVLTSIGDIDRALYELSFLADLEGRSNAEAKRKIDAARQAAVDEQFVEVDGEKFTIADRRTSLENATLEFCNKHWRAILDGVKGKTKKLTHGSVSWKKSKAGLALTEGTEEDDVVGVADEHAKSEAGVAADVLKTLQRIKITDRLTAAMLCKVTVKFDKASIWKAYQTSEITREDLEAVLLLVKEAEEFVSLKPNDYEIASQSEAAVAA